MRKRTQTHLGKLFILMFICVLMGSFWAISDSWAKKAPQDEDTKVAKDKSKQVNIKDEEVVQFLEAFEIFGRVEKPQAVLIIPGKDPTVDDILIKREFFKEIFRPVEKATITANELKMKDTPYIPY